MVYEIWFVFVFAIACHWSLSWAWRIQYTFPQSYFPMMSFIEMLPFAPMYRKTRWSCSAVGHTWLKSRQDTSYSAWELWLLPHSLHVPVRRSTSYRITRAFNYSSINLFINYHNIWQHRHIFFIHSVHVLTINISSNTRTLRYAIYDLYKFLHILAPRCWNM